MQIKNFGEKYLLYELKNKNGIILKLIDIGASISGVFMKDKNNNEIQISFGSDDYNFYLKAHDYIGSSVGRVANRIINGEFKLNNKIYKLATNIIYMAELKEYRLKNLIQKNWMIKPFYFLIFLKTEKKVILQM